jgi:hypothetical protein
MVKTKQQEDFESELVFHHREWRVQRIGWALLAVFLLLGAAGLFGDGPLSHAHSGDNDSGSIEYERFTRRGARTDIIVTPAVAGADSVQRVAITASYLQAFKIERITPEPRAVRSAGEHFVYEFAPSAAGAFVSFELEPEQLGRHAAEIIIDGGRPLTIRQLTYP